MLDQFEFPGMQTAEVCVVSERRSCERTCPDESVVVFQSQTSCHIFLSAAVEAVNITNLSVCVCGAVCETNASPAAAAAAACLSREEEECRPVLCFLTSSPLLSLEEVRKGSEESERGG